MKEYKIRLDHKYSYLGNVFRMITDLKNKANRKESIIHVDVEIRGYGELRLIMRPKDLYLVGFENKNGTFYTKDCNIPQAQGKEFFSDSGSYFNLQFKSVEPFNISTFKSHFENLINYCDGKDRYNVRRAFAIMCALVSESIRFFQEVAINIFFVKFFDDSITTAKVSPQEILDWANEWQNLSGHALAKVSCRHYDYL
ncbi:hypothetical protein Misp06_02897 [Microbulbifer sp. NBRC 101763]|uniref:ribosome-inactivating family protein n=1 Tax=Microbulbifer sp. NBRC 101763 TaxID=1113820 RepID=UPI0030A2A7FE